MTTDLAERIQTKPQAPITNGQPLIERLHLSQGDSLDFYERWPAPTAIISDGAYGVGGFDGDPTDYAELVEWYRPHVEAWSKYAAPYTTLWFWGTEKGWASVDGLLEAHGWRYEACNVWNKGKGHVAGNVNTKTLRRFPVVSEVCVQYSRDVEINGQSIKDWVISEWKRTGMPMYRANEACGVKNAASRKYLTKCHLWYFPPAEMFSKMAEYANEHGDSAGRPYFSINGKKSLTAAQWELMRSKFNCPFGVTNVWDVPPLRNGERIKVGSKSVHLNQKPFSLMEQIIEASTDPGDVTWEPFGGLFSGSIAAQKLGREAYAAESNPAVYKAAGERVRREYSALPL